MKLIKWVIKNVETLVKRMESINMTQIYWGLIVLFLFLVYNIESIKIISILVVIIWCYLFLRKSILRISLTKRVEYQNLYKENKEKNLIKENEELIKKVRKIFKIINFLNNIKVKFILLFYLFAFQKWMYRFFSWFNVKLINYPRIRVSVFVIFACIIYYPVIMIFYFYYKFWFKLIGLNFKILILKRLMELIIIMQILLFLYQYISLFWLIYIILVILSILQFVYEEYFFQTFKTAFYLNNHKNKVIRWIYRKFINDFFNLINCHLILSMKLSIGIFDCLIYSWISLLYDGFDKQIIDKDVYNILKEEQWRLGLDLIKEINIFFFFLILIYLNNIYD